MHNTDKTDAQFAPMWCYASTICSGICYGSVFVCLSQVQVKKFHSAPTTIRTQVHYNCHIKTMSYTVKHQREIKMFSVSSWRQQYRIRLGCRRGERSMWMDREWERSLAKFCTKAWYVIQAALSGSQTSSWSVRSSQSSIEKDESIGWLFDTGAPFQLSYTALPSGTRFKLWN